MDRDQPRPRTGGRSRWAGSGGRHGTEWPRAEEALGARDGVTRSEDVRLFAFVQDNEPAYGGKYGHDDRGARLPLLYMLVPSPSQQQQQEAHEAPEEGALVAAMRMAGAQLDWSQPVRSAQSGEPLLAADRERWLAGRASEPISWREAALHARGALGESLLHLCLRQSSEPPYHRLALLLLSPTEGPFDQLGVAQLARQEYEGRLHRGLSSLHLAALSDDPALVRAVLRACGAAGGAPLLSHASGAFFYGSPSRYFGGSAIGLAACSGCSASLAELLAHPEARAALHSTDDGPPPPRPLRPRSRHAAQAEAEAEAGARRPLGFCTAGNTALHCAVIRERAALLAPLMAAGASPWQRNARGQSALSLAAERGEPHVFAAVLQATATQLWGFGGSRRMCYPLLEIDSLLAPQNEVSTHP
jgi:hypothetical protein